MNIPLFHVDAFTDRPFGGNPAAVCLLTDWPAAAWLQDVAREMNLPETAFLVSRSEGFDLRWFTPKVEVELCGHATLASAHILWEKSLASRDQPIRFQTLSGELRASRLDNLIELDFPTTPPRIVPAPAGLIEALGVEPTFVGRSTFDHLVEVRSEQIVRSVQPDFARLRNVSTRGVMVTSRADGGPFDFVSRFFAPAAGIDEDPVTGSAHCCLGPFWQSKLGKDDLLAHQASERGGIVRVRVRGDRTLLGGQAVSVVEGALVRSP